jgi:hypothetical protein
MPSARAAIACLLAGTLGLSLAGAALAQDDDLTTWSQTAARGAFDLCRADAPDAGAVADHGEVWGWPRFVPYQEHPKGYRREAGGESRRTYASGDASAEVELGVQSGLVTSAAPALVHYFRCDVAADHTVNPDLDVYFTGLYGPPAIRTDQSVVWLVQTGSQAAVALDAETDDTLLKRVIAAGAGVRMMRVELTHEDKLDRARMTMFSNDPPAS